MMKQSVKPFAANLKPAAVFDDNMVLQRGMKVPVWGTAEPDKIVTVSIAGKKEGAKVLPDGTWKVEIGPFEAGGPYVMTIRGKNTVTINNVMIGEVWLCSGQSNMAMTVDTIWGRALDHEKEVREANYPQIRFFNVDQVIEEKPSDRIPGEGWREISPEAVKGFSAVAYFFGRHIHRERDVPVGLIHSSWGGTAIESWMSLESIEDVAGTEDLVEHAKAHLANFTEKQKTYDQDLEEWIERSRERDPGFQQNPLWNDPAMDDSGWKTMNLPGKWDNKGLNQFDGSVWYRREFTVPGEWADARFSFRPGRVDDEDITWINGRKVGETKEWFSARDYDVPPDAIKPGRNEICIRVLDTGGAGGIEGENGAMILSAVSGEESISLDLSGEWRYHIGVNLKDLPPRPYPPESYYAIPSVLYNAMIAPLVPYAIRGVIWYQGESNAARAVQYGKLFPGMITDWRNKWNQGNFPFLFVQLANFGARSPEPVNHDWAELREAQTEALDLPKTAMAVAIDIGEAEDIHPRNKQEVGYRLGLAARAVAYDEDIVYSGPMYREGSMKIENGKIRVFFDHVDGGLVKKGAELKGFAIAGKNRDFVWAKAKIEDDGVIVWSDEVPEPEAVRYAWGANPECNLYNLAGLPASPFRTDDRE